ncbi:hypothetical protein VHUM_00350 [Vanrija humicola]|uniref:Uncharacterized protein n=1 Tax=Vanrija humicola TaxID=5417 RepID=A0A7D9A1A6_VANHU|nr:hypothetical protein VHUM_00350 [Vanrija humicola]
MKRSCSSMRCTSKRPRVISVRHGRGCSTCSDEQSGTCQTGLSTTRGADSAQGLVEQGQGGEQGRGQADVHRCADKGV